ncbi:hypothetical protein FG379_003454 [Cryptosporidium bovis]|uniref:uncharacterized protein n=1 Tax=Cryptosporidium bovis TaxID=310047 RepID=UPI003519FAA0|nr:hypothetical protein FG379_003454 [Cryptosporidium bovis]
MSIEHEKNDINYGFFILEQYKIRRELGLLKSGNFNIVESICSKYFEPSFAFNEDKTKEIKEKYPYFELNEFERVLEELKRREELIQELLAKLERYETTLRDPEIHISSVQQAKTIK